ncbi:hypothetical protein XELAEV_18035114mg [Xenopus laevis]|uniref:Uncharacterized protein n=1 Tax=Xenopus laevis TaxID=8355 RepID=A0A974CFC3_XENLA|nr:hypothetical protein XELAEV_18035114mg [Xenopus laevis]
MSERPIAVAQCGHHFKKKKPIRHGVTAGHSLMNCLYCTALYWCSEKCSAHIYFLHYKNVLVGLGGVAFQQTNRGRSFFFLLGSDSDVMVLSHHYKKL